MVHRNILELTLLQEKIVRLFFVKAGMKLNQRQIANFLGVTPPAVMKAIPLLENAGFVKLEQDKESKRWSIWLNRDRQMVMQLKRVDNLKQIYESGLLVFLEKELAGASIILFGSYSRGEDIIHSDIDLAVIGRKDKYIDLGKYETFFERKISMHFYDSFKKIHKHLKENLCNGIMLSGGVEL